ncbi:hypothetical protein L1887_03034 [Cichorium endivia]|nr:hypothetical protein L1887_03034 [Cichorium endivia]
MAFLCSSFSFCFCFGDLLYCGCPLGVGFCMHWLCGVFAILYGALVIVVDRDSHLLLLTLQVSVFFFAVFLFLSPMWNACVVSEVGESSSFSSLGYLYTIEFQKRGLPHCHTLLWVSSPSKVVNPADVDRYITAELPDPQKDSR